MTNGHTLLRTVKKQVTLSRILATAIMLTFAFVMILPFIWMLSSSFKTAGEVMQLPIKWIPDSFDLRNYKIVWNIGDLAPRDYQFARAYLNSIIVTSITVVSTLLTSSLAGYAFAKMKFKGRNVLFLLYLSTMMIPPSVTIIPKFVIFEQLDFIGTLLPIIIPRMVSVTGTFFMRQHYMGIPDEIKEAAVIDGASEWSIWLKVMLPMTKPAFASLGVLAFLWNWNNYDEALVFLTRSSTYTIPIALNNFIDETSAQYNLIMAAAVSALVPVFIVFFLFQKNLINGITAGSVKG